MFNARTWHRLCVSAYLLFPAVIVGLLLPRDSPFGWLCAVAIGWSLLIALLGAVQGGLLALGRLRQGCPLCGRQSRVIGGSGDGMLLDCPGCGELRLKHFGRPYGFTTIRCGSPEDDLAHPRPRRGALILAPKRHAVAFALVYLPVIASVIAASCIHPFTFFYLLIPGAWCFFIGGFVLDAIADGSIHDNHGTVLRATAPVRFWCTVAIWSSAYLFAAVMPIAYALQEHAKATAIAGGGGGHATPRAAP
jgi:hypothetical protein